MVVMTSLSVLTTEGWMMVALQGTAATGGHTEKSPVCLRLFESLKPLF